MSWELDHVFFATADLGSAEAMLAKFGLAFTVRRVHQGQGTANACAMFDNAYFELLSAVDPAELRSDAVAALGLDERIRWRETGACPFGVCFRRTSAPREPAEWPFETWPYAAADVPGGASIPIVTPRWAFGEPLVFILDRSGSPPAASPPGALHRGAARSLTGAAVSRTDRSPLSAGLRWFVQEGLLPLRDGPEHLLDLHWDLRSTGMSHSFRPELPIALHW